MEVETQLELARRLGFLNETAASELGNLTGEVGRMLNALRSSLADDRRPTTGG
jgi:four helix bundle protein